MSEAKEAEQPVEEAEHHNQEVEVALAQALAIVRESSLLSARPENRADLRAHAQHAKGLVKVLKYLDKVDKDPMYNEVEEYLLTQENYDALLAQSQHAEGVASVLKRLYKRDHELEDTGVAFLLTQENYDAVLAQAQHAKGLAKVLYYLGNTWDSSLIDQENYDALLAQAQHAEGLARALSYLDAADDAAENALHAVVEGAPPAAEEDSSWLVSQENFDALLAQAQHANGLALALSSLYSESGDRNLLNQRNFNALLAQAQHAEGIGAELARLRRDGALTQESYASTLNRFRQDRPLLPITDFFSARRESKEEKKKENKEKGQKRKPPAEEGGSSDDFVVNKRPKSSP